METPDMAVATEDIAKAEVAGDQAPVNPAPETSPAEQQDHVRIFQHSTFVHVGPGAATCEDVDEEHYISTCGNPLHFHVWIHTPNQFQHNSIRTKALAAKARKMRALRDTESDPRTILDGEMEELRLNGNRDILIEEIIAKDSVKNYWQAMREIQEEEDFQTYEEDRTRLAALNAMLEEERPEEEHEELTKHLAAYSERVAETIDNIQKPIRESLQERDIDALIELVTEDRIQSEATEEFNDMYSLWEWYIGTMRLFPKETAGHPNNRYYSDIEQLKAAPPEVISGLAEAFSDLDAEAGRALGNS